MLSAQAAQRRQELAVLAMAIARSTGTPPRRLIRRGDHGDAATPMAVPLVRLHHRDSHRRRLDHVVITDFTDSC
jgi:hypothetical protein